jgi:hypothetical protein
MVSMRSLRHEFLAVRKRNRRTAGLQFEPCATRDVLLFYEPTEGIYRTFSLAFGARRNRRQQADPYCPIDLVTNLCVGPPALKQGRSPVVLLRLGFQASGGWK